ncbi:alpha-isopropylmalate synthase regulatory domain-containing protein [Vulgatibacter sp.]|uniref:alpha-isopropylmalate synthase regulatory domain-containing protein n=1 Tax=Vulgatibacter sp. TaxID=1971226 RepID=UPI003569DCC8
MAARIFLLDTTLADGIRADDIALAPIDQVRIALRLDALGVDYLEIDPRGGAARFMQEARRVALRSTRLLARVPFGSSNQRERKSALERALRFEAAGVVLHCGALEDGPDLAAAIARVRERGREAVVRFEDWFARWNAAPDRALAAVADAAAAGARHVLLRDCSASLLPRRLGEAVAAARRAAGRRVGIGVGCANDAGLAVASVIEGVGRGAVIAEGAINGYGPRCGLADLVQVAANLSLKRPGQPVLPADRLRLLAPTARFVAELANQAPDRRAPFVGDAAFLGNQRDLPLDPRRLGSRRRQPLEDGHGHSLLSRIARARGLRSHEARKLLAELRALEARGFRFEGAEASFELALRRLTGNLPHFFEVESYRCLSERVGADRRVEATCVVRVGKHRERTAANGDGPLHALDAALRRSLERFYPGLRDMRLHDYKVRLLPGPRNAAATARVLVESGDRRERWGTSGVSDDLVDASFLALVDAISWKLHKDGVRPVAPDTIAPLAASAS